MVLLKQSMHDEEITLEYINTTVNVRFSVFLENIGAAMFCLRKNNDPEIRHFLVVLYDQCDPLEFEYS